MPVSEASRRANEEYKKAKYEDVRVRVRKGRREELKDHAKKYQPSIGEVGTVGYTPQGSLNGFINRAIDETIERDKANGEIHVQRSDK